MEIYDFIKFYPFYPFYPFAWRRVVAWRNIPFLFHPTIYDNGDQKRFMWI